MHLCRGLVAISLGMIVLALGCESNLHSSKSTSDPAEVAKYRSQLVLAEEPDGAIGVLELREQLDAAKGADDTADPPADRTNDAASPAASPAATPLADVVIVGRVGGKKTGAAQGHDEFPFSKGTAGFFITDPTADEDFVHEHEEGQECPFCAKLAAQAQALVLFRDARGQTIEIDSRELFELQQADIVVVRGKVQDLDQALIIQADGIHVRR